MSITQNFYVTRRIGIDAGHRIRQHGSKCRHIHGHRYEIEATCSASSLHRGGEQDAMVLDFGFLKEEMLHTIDRFCDHGFIAESEDTEVLKLFAPQHEAFEAWFTKIENEVKTHGFAAPLETHDAMRLYVIPFAPTAEVLARHWHDRLRDRVTARSNGLAVLNRVRVWETPNCWAEYTA